MTVHFFANDADKVTAWRRYFGWTKPFEGWSPLNEYSPRFVGVIELSHKAILLYLVKPGSDGPVVDPRPREHDGAYMLWKERLPSETQEHWAEIKRFADQAEAATFETEAQVVAFRAKHNPAFGQLKGLPAPLIISCVELRRPL